VSVECAQYVMEWLLGPWDFRTFHQVIIFVFLRGLCPFQCACNCKYANDCCRGMRNEILKTDCLLAAQFTFSGKDVISAIINRWINNYYTLIRFFFLALQTVYGFYLLVATRNSKT